jgi:hypothetical protein
MTRSVALQHLSLNLLGVPVSRGPERQAPTMTRMSDEQQQQQQQQQHYDTALSPLSLVERSGIDLAR